MRPGAEPQEGCRELTWTPEALRGGGKGRLEAGSGADLALQAQTRL